MKKITVFMIPLLIYIAVLSGGSVSADGTAEISLSTVTADPGNTVDVEIRISKNPGVNTLKIKIGYDSEKLTLLSAKNEGIFERMNYSGAQTIDKNPYIMVWVNTSDIAGDGIIGILQFQVNENAAPGDATLSLTCNFCTNQNYQNVDVTLQNGGISISGAAQPSTAPPAPSPATGSASPSAGQITPPGVTPAPEQTNTPDSTQKTGTPAVDSTPDSTLINSSDPSKNVSSTSGASTQGEDSTSSKWWLLLLLLIPAGGATGYFIYKKKL
jgi:cohesin domain